MVTLGAWEGSVLPVFLLLSHEEAKGKERKGTSTAAGKEDMLCTGVDRESISSSSTQVTLQPPAWALASKLVTQKLTPGLG